MSDIVKDLTIERYKLKETNPVRANVVIPMILSESKDLAKKAGREVSIQDIQQVAKSYLKKLENTMKSYEGLPSSGPLEQIKKEIEEVKTFLPQTKSEQETRDWIAKEVGLGKVESNKHIGSIMAKVPEGYDKGLVSKILKGLMG